MGRKTLAKKVAPSKEKRARRKKTPVVELLAVEEPLSMVPEVFSNPYQLNLFD